MITVAEACLGRKFAAEPLIVGTSGRYEFRNKGLDVFLESLKKLAASEKLQREVLAYITVPAGNRGPVPTCRPIWPTPRSRSIRTSTAIRPTCSKTSPATPSPHRSAAASSTHPSRRSR